MKQHVQRHQHSMVFGLAQEVGNIQQEVNGIALEASDIAQEVSDIAQEVGNPAKEVKISNCLWATSQIVYVYKALFYA